MAALDYSSFFRELQAVFNHSHQGRFCRQVLLRLSQGLRSAADYDMAFWTLAAGTCWKEPAHMDAFLGGLRAELQVELSCKQEATTLNEVVHIAITYDRLLQERCHYLHRDSPQQEGTITPRQTNVSEEPMQLDAVGVQPRVGEQKRGSNPVSCSLTHSMFNLPVEVSYKGCLLSASALVDSGAAGNVMDWNFAKRLGIKAIALPSLLSIQILDGGLVGPGYITHVTPCVRLITEGAHTERIAFFLFPSRSPSHTRSAVSACSQSASAVDQISHSAVGTLMQPKVLPYQGCAAQGDLDRAPEQKSRSPFPRGTRTWCRFSVPQRPLPLGLGLRQYPQGGGCTPQV
ncbi:hypothetical protein P4O66_003413 [Electrophorus voltai]|uniref:Retrotransposon gag domain-containing protein n=1 Tax=Electrophorus voltai TaxID=2609070 RepID=A0AAD9DM02_9TELE|nr:hypothetical protein P4O66_003413 [Electrophorus voltai]